MDIATKNYDTARVLEIRGDIDGHTAPQVQMQILAEMQPGLPLLIDMSAVSFMSSAGLRVLLTTYRQALQAKNKVMLVGLSEEIKETMSATGFLSFFEIRPSVEDGLKALQ